VGIDMERSGHAHAAKAPLASGGEYQGRVADSGYAAIA